MPRDEYVRLLLVDQAGLAVDAIHHMLAELAVFELALSVEEKFFCV